MQKTYTLNELPGLAKELLPLIDTSIVCFEGEMGAGKTTLIKALCRAMGVEDRVSSPTFSLINEYRDLKNQPIYHFDCYRIESPEEAYDFGAEEYLSSGALCFIEWHRNIERLLPAHYCLITIQKKQEQERLLNLQSL